MVSKSFRSILTRFSILNIR